ncbi:MAG: tetratricopeptide repeat protein [Candidatus Erginobacter occultus]|nr:tetratricopeptide repeat protein [Candidatus Erginobacter occultus]
MMKVKIGCLMPLVLILAAGTGCRPPASNDLYLARIYRAQGQEGEAYNAIKRYLAAHQDRRAEEELRRISLLLDPAGGEVLPPEAATLDRDEILEHYLEESRRKLEEYEELYSRFPISPLEEGGPAPTSELFPITVVLDRDVLAVALVTLDDYLVLLADVSIMYKDHLHYQNPYLMSGVMLGMRGFYPEAAGQFHEAIALDPNNPRAFNNLGITYFKMGEFKSARDTLLQALKLQPDNIFARNNLGLTYLKLGERDRAEESFRMVLRRDPFNLAANFYLGFSYFSAGELERAQRFYREADGINPSLPQVNFALGSVMVRMDRWDEAIDYFQKTIALDGGFYRAYVSLGGVYNRKGMYEEAEKILIQAIELEPDYGPAYYNLACVQALQDRREAAIKNLRKAVEKGFSDRAFILDDPDLASLRADPAFQDIIRGL